MTEHLTPVEAIMWRAGHDPAMRMTVGHLMMLDTTPSLDDVAKRLTSVAEQHPRLRHRPDDRSRPLARPAWIEDREFDSASHLKALTLGGTGGWRELLDLVALLEAAPFDRDRPPWDATLVDGLEGGKAALYLRAHHVLTDGIGSVGLVGGLADDHAAPPRVRAPKPNGDDGRPSASWIGTAATFSLERAAAAMREATAAVNADPVGAVLRGLQRAVDTISSVTRQVIVPGESLSTLPAAASALSRLEVISVPHARSAAIALGGSRNDLLVAAAALGLGHYHRELGVPATAFRVATPTIRHREDPAAGNWFTPMRLELPSTAARPAGLFSVVADRLLQARREPGIGLTEVIAAGANLLPDSVLVPVLRSQANTVDFAATAFPGSRQALHIGGARVEAAFPFGPRLSRSMNITAVGNADRLDVGVALDRTAIAQPDLLIRCVTEAFEALADAT